MKTTVIIWTFLVPLLLLWWIFQRAAGQRGWIPTLVAGGVALAATCFPWFGHPLPYWSSSLSANFSVIMVVMLIVGILDRAGLAGVFRPRDWKAAWIFGATASVLLYPSALGLGPQNFDSYALGWPWLFWGQSLVLFGGAGSAAALLIWRGNRFGLVLGLALLGYAIGFQESENLWDYLLDPVFGAVSLLVVLAWLTRRFIFRSAKSDPAGTADR
jgi:hypothetical protein